MMSSGDPDQAWKVLALVNDWVKHAEAKAGASLTLAFAIAGLLYNLVKAEQHPSGWVITLAAVCAITSLAAVCLAGWSLRPRLRPTEPPTNLLYFDHIARKHPRVGGPAPYVADLRVPLTNTDDLFDQIAHQVWANSHVARDKFLWGGASMIFAFISAIALAWTAVALLVTA
jgi:hypothetical protein